MNNSGMELNAILHAPDAPDVPGKKDPLVKMGDVFKNPDGSRIVVERVDHNSGDSIVYSSEHGSLKRQILGRPIKNFLVHVGMQDMEAIDPIQNREPLFYEAYEKQMEVLANAFSREFFACEKALDRRWDGIDKDVDGAFELLSGVQLLRQRIDEIADEWESIDSRLLRGGDRRMTLLSEIRKFAEEKIDVHAELSQWRQEALAELAGEHGTDELNPSLVQRGYLRDELHYKVENLLKKCRRSQKEGIPLLEFEREVHRLEDSVVGYDPQDSEKESPVEYIKEVLDTLGKMDREAFHLEKDGEMEMGKRSHKKGSRLRKKSLLDGADPTKLKDKKRKEVKKTGFNKRGVIEENDSPVVIPPTMAENGVQSGEGMVATPVSENIQTQQSMKNPGESISAAEKSTEKESELLRAFKEVAKGEEERILAEIQHAKTFKALKGIGFLVGKRRYFLEATGEDITPALKEGIEAITNKKGGSEDARDASVFLTAVNQTLEDAWKARRNELTEKKPSRATQEDSESPEAIFSELVKVLGKRRNPFKNDDKEVVIELVTSEQIVFRYRNNETEGKWKIGKIKSPQAKRFAEELQKNFGFELRRKKSSKKDKDSAKTTDNGDQVIRGQSDAPTSTPVGNPGDQPPLSDEVSPEPVVGTVAGSAKEGIETPTRTYEELFKEADADGYHDILFGAAVAGINTMKEGAQKESVDLKTYNIDHPGEILGALIDGMKDSFARVGGKFGWSESETDMYARDLVNKSIEKYLK